MSLLVAGNMGPIKVTPESAGLSYVGFEALSVETDKGRIRRTGEREVCIVVLSGRCDVNSDQGEFSSVGRRESPFDGPPHAVYLPPNSTFSLDTANGSCEVALCFAPAIHGVEPRLIAPDDRRKEMRGTGEMERQIYNILMTDVPAERLLVTEVLTPPGHWSSYPPHKHDRDAPPQESHLEEIYYHRIRPSRGFGVQLVYTKDRSVDESISFTDRDVVLVPRGYHAVAAPPGYELYYLNAMAGPRREWLVQNDPDHDWLAEARGSTTA